MNQVADTIRTIFERYLKVSLLSNTRCPIQASTQEILSTAATVFFPQRHISQWLLSAYCVRDDTITSHVMHINTECTFYRLQLSDSCGSTAVTAQEELLPIVLKEDVRRQL